jgi:hypothetical protein
MRLTSTGLGIGTSSPATTLDIVGNSRILYGTGATNTGDQNVIVAGVTTSGAYSASYGAGIQFQITNSGGGYSGSRIISRLNADNNTANLIFQARNYGFSDSMTLTNSGQLGIGTSSPSRNLDVGAFSGNNAIAINSGSTGASTIYFANGSSTPNVYNGYIQYDHNINAMEFGSNGGVERMRIDSSGNVGVGSSSPSDRLTVNDPNTTSFTYTTTRGSLGIENSANAGNTGALGASIIFRQRFSASSALIQTGAIISVKTAATGNFGGGLAFYAQPQSAGDMFEVMRYTSDGYVGIGTTPSNPLQVVAGNNNDTLTRILVANSNSGSSATSYMLFGNDTAAGGAAGSRMSSSTNTSYGGANALQIFNNIGDISMSVAGVDVAHFTNANNLNFKQSGGGIVFTNSSALTNSTLNDYETGTWTPTFNNFSGTSGWTFANAFYTKIGRTVFLTCQIAPGSGTISTTANYSFIGGIPFSVTGANSPCSFATNYIDGLGTGLIYATTGVYTPAFSVASSRTIFFTGTYQTSF